MKVLLYFENEKALKKSGVGRALKHQKMALEKNGIEWTTNIHDDYDLIHINTVFANSYRLLKKANKKNIPVVVHGHSTKEDFLNSFLCSNIIAPWFNNRLLKMYTNANTIITPTPYSKGLIENYEGVNAKVYAISNGIDLETYAISHETSDEDFSDFKKKFNIKDGQKFIICIGLCFVRKGLVDFCKIAKEMPKIKFIWFGQKYKIISSFAVKKAIRNRPSNVIFPGYVDFKYIKSAMAHASLFFFPSYEENEGIVVLESLASKLPILVRDIPVFSDWLTDGVNCYKAKDNAGFIEKINFIINNDNSEIVENGYKVVEERNLKLIGEKLKAVYEEVINNTQK